jgi:hypothetical protein
MLAVMDTAGGKVRRTALATLLRLAVAVLLMTGLSACAIPPAVTIASLAADGVLLAATGKSKADHGLSLATGRDCSTFRIFDDQNVCQDDVIAQAEPMPAEVARDLDRLRAPASTDAPAPRQALMVAFRSDGPAPLIATQMPRPLDAVEVRSVQVAGLSASLAHGHSSMAVAPGPFKVASTAPYRSPSLVHAGLKAGKVVTAKGSKRPDFGKRLASGKFGKKVAHAGHSLRKGGKGGPLGLKTAKAPAPILGNKVPPRKVSVLKPAKPVLVAMR